MASDEQPQPTSNELASQRTDLAVDRTLWAVERTLMAWIRTGLSMIGFGFTIYRFLEGVGTARPDAPRNVGLFLLVLGTAATSFGSIDYLLIMRTLHSRYGLRFRVFPLILGALIALLGLVLSIWVLVESGRL